MKAAVALLVAVVLMAPYAQRRDGITFSSLGFWEQQSPVEQMSDWPWAPSITDCSANVRCTVNPTPCSWDVDDHWQEWVQGTLAGGQFVTRSSCLIASQDPVWLSVNGVDGWYDWPTDRFYVDLRAPSAALVVSVAFDPGEVVAANVRPDGRAYRYTICAAPSYPPDDPLLQPIAGSARGTDGRDALGVRTTVTLTIANPGTKNVRSITGFIGMTGTDLTYCA